MALTARQVCLDALQEIRVVSAVEAGQPEDLDFALRRLNRILDAWNANSQAIYALQTLTFTIVPGLNPQTIGPTGQWITPQRPQEILYANLIQSGGIRAPIELHNANWWMHVGSPLVQADTLTHAYYQPSWPDGQLFCVPVPGSADPIELQVRQVLTALAFDDVFSLPPGYQEALTLSLAEAIVPAMRVEMPSGLPLFAQKARANVFEQNVPTPPLFTTDFGVPSNVRSGFNWRTGEPF